MRLSTLPTSSSRPRRASTLGKEHRSCAQPFCASSNASSYPSGGKRDRENSRVQVGGAPGSRNLGGGGGAFPQTLTLNVNHLTVLQARFHSQAMAETLLMTVPTIMPPSDFTTKKERLVEILTIYNLNKNVEEVIHNIKVLLS